VKEEILLPNGTPKTPKTKSLRRALLVQYKRIGDTLLLEPLIRSLREAGWHVSLGALPSCVPAAQLTRADSILVWRSGFGAVRNIIEIASAGFDVCIDAGGTDRCMLAAIASRAPIRILPARFRKFRTRKLVYNRFVETSVMDRHTIDHFLDLLAPLGVPPVSPPVMRLDASKLPALEDSPVTAPLAGTSYVVCHVGAARPEKFWSVTKWTELLSALLAERPGLRIVLTGAMGERETEQRQAICEAIPEAVDLGGKCDLALTAAVFRGAALVITVDSMSVHLASGLGAATLALFGPTNPKNWGPRGLRCASVQDQTAHTDPEAFPRGNPISLTVGLIPVSLALETALKLMSPSSGA